MTTFVFYIGSKPLPRYGFKPSPPNGCGSPLFGVHVNNFFSLISFVTVSLIFLVMQDLSVSSSSQIILLTVIIVFIRF